MTETLTINNAPVEARVYFAGEKWPYRIRCRNERFLICTKPFNINKTVIYCIVDLVLNIRGADNKLMWMGYESDEGCAEALTQLAAGTMEVSGRNRVPLDIVEVRINRKGRKS